MTTLKGLMLIAAAIALPLWANANGHTPGRFAEHYGLPKWETLREKMGLPMTTVPSNCELAETKP